MKSMSFSLWMMVATPFAACGATTLALEYNKAKSYQETFDSMEKGCYSMEKGSDTHTICVRGHEVIYGKEHRCK